MRAIPLLLLLLAVPVQAAEPGQGEIRVSCQIDGEPVLGQEFTLQGPVSQKEETDDAGTCRFPELPDGRYRIQGQGFSPMEVTLPLDGERSVTVEAKHEGTGEAKSPDMGRKTAPPPGKLPQTGQPWLPFLAAGLFGALLSGTACLAHRRKGAAYRCFLFCCGAALWGACLTGYQDRYGAVKAGAALEAFDQMPEAPGGKEIDGHLFLGTLSIPKLKKELPVQDAWSEANGRISPCRYAGDAQEGTLIIAGHSSRAHFGYLGKLKPGDAAYFTESSGERHSYRVQGTERISGTDKEGMCAPGDWDLTLFTCTTSGRDRITVRLVKLTD